MKIDLIKLRLYLSQIKMSLQEFMKLADFDASISINTLLCSDLDRENSEKFINTVGAEDAYNLIDWEKMDVRKPSRREIFVYAN